MNKDSGTREIVLDLLSRCNKCVEGISHRFGPEGGWWFQYRVPPFHEVICDTCKGDYKFKELELEVSVINEVL